MAKIDGKIGYNIQWDSRPCLVGGKKAFWHMWTYKETLYLKFDSFLLPAMQERIAYQFKHDLICGPDGHIEKESILLGVVEFEDGSVDMVEPKSIKFMDSYNKFREVYWGMYEEGQNKEEE